MTTERIARVARDLSEALDTLSPIAPIADQLESVDEAYQVQALVMGARENSANPLVGHKVGLTAEAVRAQLGVHQPDFGVLLADMHMPAGVPLDLNALIQPKVEAEIAFVLATDIDSLDRESVLAAVDYVTAALEIVDSRIVDWRIGYFDTVADNASSGMFVLGDAKVSVRGIDLRDVEMTMTIDGERVSAGRGSDCLGDPVEALVWVAKTAAEQGRPLRAGEVVLSGALGPMVALSPGTQVVAEITGVGRVAVEVGEKTA